MLEKSFNAGSIKYMTVMKRWIMIRNSPWPLSQCPTRALKASFSLLLGWRLEVGTGRAGMDEGRRSISWAHFVPEPGWGAQDSWLFTICFTIFLFFFLIYFLYGEQLLYSIMLVSVIQQHGSAIIIFISLPSGTSHPIPSTPLGHHRGDSCVI